MPLDPQQTQARRIIGETSPEPASLSENAPFGDMWARPEPRPRHRSMSTIASLITDGGGKRPYGHPVRARVNSHSVDELVEAITHLAFYAGRAKAISAVGDAAEVLGV
ncbi:carboxymuconolactone decarboxylase family protein [Streptomyces sp. NPDC097610]|uniref:carboxymuconolactone decarboxylase family protein n=1 Tax=Streptomyces sp. NPDC097610 TaxID=3157227 RepID=UPI003332DB42